MKRKKVKRLRKHLRDALHFGEAMYKLVGKDLAELRALDARIAELARENKSLRDRLAERTPVAPGDFPYVDLRGATCETDIGA